MWGTHAGRKLFLQLIYLMWKIARKCSGWTEVEERKKCYSTEQPDVLRKSEIASRKIIIFGCVYAFRYVTQISRQ